MVMSRNSDTPADWVMSEQRLRAVVDCWSPQVCELARKIERLPYKTDPEGKWGFIHGLDKLRNNLSAIVALRLVVDEWEVRPRYAEVLRVADAVTEIRWEVRRLAAYHRRRYGPTKKFRFVRRN